MRRYRRVKDGAHSLCSLEDGRPETGLKKLFHLPNMTWIWKEDAFNSSVYTAYSVLLHVKSGLPMMDPGRFLCVHMCWDIPGYAKRVRGRLGSRIRFLPSCYLELVLNPCLRTPWSEGNLGTEGDIWGTVHIQSSEVRMLSRGPVGNTIKRVSAQENSALHLAGEGWRKTTVSTWDVQMSISFWS